MEAASIPLGAQGPRMSAPVVLRLCSDEQLVERYRAGRDESFGVIHERYRTRLMAYVRQMLSGRSNEDVEDVLQDIFMRAAMTLRSGAAPIGLRPWLYSVAHNRCIDELRRRPPASPDVFAVSRQPASDTSAVAERRADVERLFRDLRALPELQRSALLMRELQGLTHVELATALDATVPAIKSLLVRARVGLVDAEEAREAPCAGIREGLAEAHDRRVKANAQAARHLRECAACSSYRAELRSTSRRLAALVPGPVFLPFALLGRLFGGSAAHVEVPAATTGIASSGGAAIGIGKIAAILSVAAVATTGVVLDQTGVLKNMQLPWDSQSTPGLRLAPVDASTTPTTARLTVPGGSTEASVALPAGTSNSISATVTPSATAPSTSVTGSVAQPGDPQQPASPTAASSTLSLPVAAGGVATSAPTQASAQAGGAGVGAGGGNPVPRSSARLVDENLSGAPKVLGRTVSTVSGVLSKLVGGAGPTVSSAAGAVSSVAGAVSSTVAGNVGPAVSDATAGVAGVASPTPSSSGAADGGPIARVTGAVSGAASGIELNGQPVPKLGTTLAKIQPGVGKLNL